MQPWHAMYHFVARNLLYIQVKFESISSILREVMPHLVRSLEISLKTIIWTKKFLFYFFIISYQLTFNIWSVDLSALSRPLDVCSLTPRACWLLPGEFSTTLLGFSFTDLLCWWSFASVVSFQLHPISARWGCSLGTVPATEGLDSCIFCRGTPGLFLPYASDYYHVGRSKIC